MAVISEGNNDANAGIETQYSISMGDSFQGSLTTADDVDWVKVELDSDTIYDISQIEGEDLRLTLLDSEGNYAVDGRGSLPGDKLIFSPDESGTYYIGIKNRGDEAAGTYEISLVENTIPIGAYDEIADYLTQGFYEDSGLTPDKFDIETGDVLTADITALNEDGQRLARWALEAWTYVTGIEFEFVEDGADITFDDNGVGASASKTSTGGIISSADINISEEWLIINGTGIGSYSLGTYIHEIGHALGLGHLKPDTYSSTFGVGEEFLLNSYQASNMSGYFQNRNTFINASPARPQTPMIADILAVHNLYGEPEDSNGGDTVYGYQSNLDGFLGKLFSLWTGDNNPFITLISQDYAGLDHYTLVASGDLDGDGDLDLVTGSQDGALHYFENTGTASAPAFTKRNGENNPTDGIVLEQYSLPELADLDGDGDLDLITGSISGELAYYENTGAANAPVFTHRTGSANPIPRINEGSFTSVAFGDLDDDGDLDLITGNSEGDLTYFENTGSATSPDFTGRTGPASPVNGLGNDTTDAPELVDLDNDGDFDLVVWGWYGVITYFENTGSSTDPVFTERIGDGMPLGLIANNYAPPVLADLDGDGDLDLVALHNSVTLHYFVNDGTAAEPDFIMEGLAGPAALTLYDTGGTDTLDLRTDREDQRIDLRPEGISDVYRLIGNLVIARDVVIENAIAGFGNDVIIGNEAVNRLEGRAGDDVLEGGAGADTLDGGAGNDTAAYTGSDTGVSVRLLTGAGQRGHAEGDSLSGIENLTGSAHNDAFGGDTGNNILNGGPGNDGLWGSGGDDILIGGPGADRFYGGSGQDTADYTDSPAGVTVRLHSLTAAGGDAEGDTFPGRVDVAYTDADGVEQTESLPDIENLTGSAYNDVLAGDRRDNVLDGSAGDDTLYGGPGGGDDVMLGNSGDDRLFGGQGSDRLDGGTGDDALSGGPAGDVFVFAPGHGADTIADFTDTEDKIDLTAFDLSGYNDLTFTSGTDGVTIDLSTHDGGTILLEGFDMADLDAADFLF